MADIFISWGSPDRDAVLPLRDRLKGLGLEVWEYSEDMQAGDQIQARVMKTIEQARIAILCLSDAAVAREWVMNEIAVCASAKQAGRVEHIIPVKVGALTRSNVPVALSNLNLFILDLSDPAHMAENLERLVNDINEILDEAAPLIMPAAIFAMNESESMRLFADLRRTYEAKAKQGQETQAGQESLAEAEPPPESGAVTGRETPTGEGVPGREAEAAGEGWEEEEEDEEGDDPQLTEEQEELWKLCKLVGMDDPPDLYNFLQTRYGSTPEAMTPFESGKKIIDVIDEIVAGVNAARVRNNHRPIFLRWVTNQLFKGRSQERRIVRDWWRSRDSLLIIDSVSTFYQPIKQRLDQLRTERSAILWLPPYTQHTADMERALRSAAEAVPALGDEFTDWGIGKNPKRSVSFDTSTSLALQVWLRRALYQVSDESGALEGNVKDIRSENPPPGGIGAKIFRRKGSAK